MSNQLAKNFSSSYIYNLGSYEERLFKYVMSSERIDKNHPSFDDIKLDVKRRQIMNSLVKVLESNKVELMLTPTPMPKAFKTLAMKDVKEDGKLKVFIDADMIKFVDGQYKCNSADTDRLIAYLLSGMTQMVYYLDPKRLLMISDVIKSGTRCFSSLFNYIIDYLYKTSITPGIKGRCLYLSSMYFLRNIMCKDITPSLRHMCREIAGISEKEEELITIQIDDTAYDNIKTFIEELGRVLKLPKLTLDVFLEKWLYLYGVGTQFALEIFPAFSSMITNCYVGCYLNNQKTIEKIIGRDLVTYSSAIMRVGGESV